jgi:hypothetical protein
MKIDLNKFGPTLVSRQGGREALAAFRPILRTLKKAEILEIDFSKVGVLSPSWADEFIGALLTEYPGRVRLGSSNNPSVQATLQLLERIWKSDTYPSIP